MPNSSLKAAIKEAYALAKSNVRYLDTIELSHPDVTPSKYLVRNREDLDLTLEGGGGEKTFRACAFRINLPSSGANGLQEINVAIDNVDREISDFINAVKLSPTKVTLTYRPYLSTDYSEPQMDPPLVLTLSDIVVTPVEVTARASFQDLINMPFLNQLYTRKRFPGLGN